MARVHPGNLNSQLPDHRSSSDHVDEQPRNHDFMKKSSYSDANRDGGGVRAGGGRGRGRGEHVRRCYRCHDPGHIVRDCPFSGNSLYGGRVNQASVNDTAKTEAIEYTSATNNVRTKPMNSSSEISKNVETIKPYYKESPPNPLQAKLQQKEKELQLRDEEIESLNIKLNKATSDMNLCEFKNEEMSLEIKKLKENLEKTRKEVAYWQEADVESHNRWCFLKSELEETKDELNEKIQELEEASETADFEMMKMKLEIEQWRKAAKAAASVFIEGADICSKTSELESLVLYYSNRASKRMSLGKIRKALDDCKKSTLLDPGFLKCCLTAGNCHLVLGNIDDALYNYKKCLDSGMVCLDRRLTIEASDGLQNAEKVVECINKFSEFLQHKTYESATTALEVITEALSISRYSEKLLEMKGEALLMLHKYEEVIQMCEETLAFAEKNCATIDDGNQTSVEDQIRPLKLWRLSLMSRSYFHMAKFDLALTTLEKYEQLEPLKTRTNGPSSPSSATISELLRCKNAGNEAFKGGKYREAVKHYSKALTQNIESKSFTAICLCNRAAALQALGEITDAIADCNLAIALDSDYMKAISRRAKLHEKIRDYEQAAVDFKRLISLLEKKSERKYEDDLTLARRNLSSVNKNMKKEITYDLYLILGLKGSESGSEIKKAYHKAALRHHPDKAGKFLARSECGVDGHVWKDIFKIIHEDADKLFKKIGEAYAVLSDTNKRFNYNLQNTMHDDFWGSFND